MSFALTHDRTLVLDVPHKIDQKKRPEMISNIDKPFFHIRSKDRFILAFFKNQFYWTALVLKWNQALHRLWSYCPRIPEGALCIGLRAVEWQSF